MPIHYEFDFNLTVSPTYTGEHKDCLGLYKALTTRGYSVNITYLSPITNIRREVNLEFPCKFNINFHSSYRPSRDAQHNFLFYHEVHDKTCRFDVPFGIFSEYVSVFTPAKRFGEAMGINPLRMATDSYLFQKTQAKDEYKCDIVFVGSMHEFRDPDSAQEYLLPLCEKYNVHIWGKGWDKEVFGDAVKGELPMVDTPAVYSSAKVGLNFVSVSMRTWGLGTNRLYDMGACGLPSVSYSCRDYQDAYGYDEKMVMWADTPEEVHEKVKYLLENPKVAKTLGKRFQRQTLTDNTWDNRVDDLLEIMQNPDQTFRAIPEQDLKLAEVLPVHHPNFISTSNLDLLIAIPGPLEKTYAQKLAWMLSWGRSRVSTEIDLFRGSFRLDDCRNQICDFAYDNHIPWLLMIDDDTCPSKDHLNYLVDSIQRGHKIISGWYVNEHPDTNVDEPLIWVDDGFGGDVRLTTLPRNRYIKASFVPGGFLCISWDVINEFKKRKVPMFYFTNGKPKDHPDVLKYGVMSEDKWFSLNAKALGFDLIVDTRLECEHIKTVVKGGRRKYTT